MPEWAVQLDAADEPYVSRLRGAAGVQVCESNGAIWVRGNSETMEPQTVALPGQHFQVLPDGQLVPQGKRVPLGHLPDEEWTSIIDWVQVELPVAGWASGEPPKFSIELVRSESHQHNEPTAMVCKPADWLSFSNTTAQVRLQPLKFAVANDGRVLIMGTPLPPLPGVRLVVHGSLAVPVGLHWSPAIDVSVVRRVFGNSATDDAGLVLWLSTDEWEFIHETSFVNATRGAIRESLTAQREDRG